MRYVLMALGIGLIGACFVFSLFAWESDQKLQSLAIQGSIPNPLRDSGALGGGTMTSAERFEAKKKADTNKAIACGVPGAALTLCGLFMSKKSKKSDEGPTEE